MTAGAPTVARRGLDDDPAELARALAEGGVLAFPTESSYGLGVAPDDARGVTVVFELKGRPAEKALPVVAADLAALAALGVDLDSPAIRWAAPRWPAALTVVAPLRAPVAASGGRAELAVRIPGRADLRRLLAAVGGSLTATSANPSGQPPLVDPEAVADWLAGASVRAVVVGSEPSPGGLPSTLVAFDEGRPRVLRQGRVPIA